MSALDRDQKRIDAIGWSLHDQGLLKDEQIHQLAHDWGDLESAGVQFCRMLDEVRSTLPNLSANPKECWMAFLGILGWFDEFRTHMDSAEPLIELVCKEIERRHPEINPEDDGPDES